MEGKPEDKADNGTLQKFKSLLSEINTKNSKLIGTNQMIQGNIDYYSDLKNIISINFNSCVGIFCYSDKNFLFIHSDLSCLKEVPGKIENFYKYNDKKPINVLCFFSEGIKTSKSTKKKLSIALPDKIKHIDQNSFEIISLNLRNNKRSFFDLFLEVSPMRNIPSQKPSYHYLEYDDDLEIDPYMPDKYKKEYKDKYYPNSKGNDILFYLNNEKQPIITNRLYLSGFINQARDKSPFRINKGFETTYDLEIASTIEDISGFKKILLGEKLCRALENKNFKNIKSSLFDIAKEGLSTDQAGLDGRSPLQVIIDSKNIEIDDLIRLTKILLTCGADINQKSRLTGETILHKLLINKFNIKTRDIIKSILELHPEIKIDSKALILAIEKGYSTIARSLIKTKSLNLNEAGESGVTPLIKATQKKDAIIAQSLVKFGANPNQENIKTGETPLSIAVKNGYEELVEILLKADGIKIDDQILKITKDEKILKMLEEAKSDIDIKDINQKDYVKIFKVQEEIILNSGKKSEDMEIKINPKYKAKERVAVEEFSLKKSFKELNIPSSSISPSDSNELKSSSSKENKKI